MYRLKWETITVNLGMIGKYDSVVVKRILSDQTLK